MHTYRRFLSSWQSAPFRFSPQKKQSGSSIVIRRAPARFNGFFASHCILYTLPYHQPAPPPPSRNICAWKFFWRRMNVVLFESCCFLLTSRFAHTASSSTHPLAKCPISFGVVQVLLNDVEEIFKLGSSTELQLFEKIYFSLVLSVLWIAKWNRREKA